MLLLFLAFRCVEVASGEAIVVVVLESDDGETKLVRDMSRAADEVGVTADVVREDLRVR